MVDIITETLEDGTEYSFDMDVSHEVTDHIFESLADMQGELENFDFEATVFCVFACALSVLSQAGWSAESLKEEIDSQISVNKAAMN